MKESNAADGARIQLEWSTDMRVRLVTFELQPEGASKLHAPVAFWSLRVPSDGTHMVVPGLPKGRWTVTAWPQAGAERHSGQASFVVEQENLAVRLAP